MESVLINHSNIFAAKFKFFLTRAVGYFFFLLFPIFLQKTVELNDGLQMGMMFIYILFIFGQWFLLGKEIDHRLKIYFRVNSSIDKIVYRLLLGQSFFLIYFNILNLLPNKWTYNFFWITWIFLGLFYSWPTRGKIIEESMSSHFSNAKYLDSFEKTLLALIVFFFIASIPELPNLKDINALKLYLDPAEKFSDFFK